MPADDWRRRHLAARDCRDAGWRLHRAERREDLVVRRDDVDALAFERAGELALLSHFPQSRGGDDHHLEERPGQMRILHEVNTVEQNTLAGRIGMVGWL